MADKCPDCERPDCPDYRSATGMNSEDVNDCKEAALSLLRSQLRASEDALAQSRENEATEARRVDELLQDRTRARNETIAALEKLAASEAECERLRREVEDVRKLDGVDWSMRPGPRQQGPDSYCEIWPFSDEARSFQAESPVAARRAAVEYLEARENKT